MIIFQPIRLLNIVMENKVMEYITGQFALNLPCSLKTTGDWHTSAMNWGKVYTYDSENSIFKDYGIELNKPIPEHDKRYNVANHIRAILDLLAEKKFYLITNFRDDYICNELYTTEIFEKTVLLLPDKELFDFMYKTYGKEWKRWTGKHNIIS